MSFRPVVFQVISEFSDVAPAESAAVLAKYLDRSKFQVLAVSLRAQSGDEPSRIVGDLERAGIRHVSMEARGSSDVAAVLRLVRFIRAWRPAVVHSHSVPADLWCGVAGRLARVPLVVNTIRNHDAHIFRAELSWLTGKFAVAVSRFSTTLADQVVAVSDGVAEYLVQDQNVATSKIHVIRNGFDFKRLDEVTSRRSDIRSEMGWSDDDVVIGTLAILKRRKGLEFLIDAACKVILTHPKARFFVAGDGEERQALETHISRLGIENRFHLLGHRSDPLALLDATDLYVLPSLLEGLPRSLLEAMVLEKPVVVTDIGGSREVVRDDVSGLVVPSGNVSDLAGAILRLVASPELRCRFGGAGRRTVVDHFDARGTAAGHELLYQLLLEKTGIPTQRGSSMSDAGVVGS